MELAIDRSVSGDICNLNAAIRKLKEGVLPLRGAVLHYGWGKDSQDSIVARLSKELYHLGTPCAEWWLGTHPSGMSTLRSTDQALLSFLANDPALHLGNIRDQSDSFQLPFLLKVLAIAKPLSIQIHPDRIAAMGLHAKNPGLYPDPNHKPEMAVALTKVALLYGFRPFTELLQVIESFEWCRELVAARPVGEPVSAARHEEFLRDIIGKLLALSPVEIAAALSAVDTKVVGAAHAELYSSVLSEFGDQDAGVLLMLLMNIIELSPGEAIFIESNTPHAYLAGDLVECMAASDNVIRAGLTPKHKDLDAALSLIRVLCDPPRILSPQLMEKGGSFYECPIEDFALRSFSREVANVEASNSPRILCCVEGQGKISGMGDSIEVGIGDAFFISAGVFESLIYDATDALFYEATVPPRGCPPLGSV